VGRWVVNWALGRSTETGRGFLADSQGGRFDFDRDRFTLEALIEGLTEMLEEVDQP
jgi:hypothetical protein